MKIKRLVLIMASLPLLTGCFSAPPQDGNDDYCPIDQVHYAYDEKEHWLELNEGADCLIPYGYNGAHEFEEHVVNVGDETHDREVDFVCSACHYTKHVTYPCIGNQFLEHTALKLSDDGTYYIIESIEHFNNEFDYIYFPLTYNNLPVKGIESLDDRWANDDKKIIIPEGYTYLGAGFLSQAGAGGFIYIPSSVNEIKEGALANYGDMIHTNYTQEEGTTLLSKLGYQGLGKIIYEVTSDYKPTIKDNIQYILDNSNHTASVVNIFGSSRFDGKSTPLVIPNTVGFNSEYQVTRIENGACLGKYIDSSVFSNSNLNYIGKMGFINCLFNNGVNIPATFITINESAFEKASIGELTLNEGLSRIEKYAFYEADIDELTIPASVEYIGMFAFAGCPFETITLPQTIKTLGRGAFNSVRKAYFNCLDVTLFDDVTDADKNSSPFSDLREITIGDGVTTVPSELCYNCWRMETVVFSSTVEVIGAGAFKGTRAGNPSTDSTIFKQGSLVLPSSLRIIGASAFYESPFSSKHLALPKTLETIGAFAFYEAEFIEEFTYDDTMADFTLNVTCGENWNLYQDYWGEHYIPVQCRDGAIS